MNIYEVQPIFSHPTHPFELTIDAPGSKSITNRALMLAALANGETLLKGALFSDDSRHFLQCLKDLGFDVVVDEPAHTVRVTGLGGRIPKETAAINVGSAGTAARFLTAMLGCAKGVWHLDASEQMKKRPMAALLNTLTDLGCRIDCHEKEGYFPFTIYSEGITASEATVDIGDSSQMFWRAGLPVLCLDIYENGKLYSSFFLSLRLDITTDNINRCTTRCQQTETLTPECFLPKSFPDLWIFLF